MAEDCFIDPAIASFLRDFNPPLPEPLRSLEKSSREAGLPVSSAETIRLIRFLCELKQPHRILELGTCVGFSALVMSDACPDAELITIERNLVMIHDAQKNIDELGNGRITVIPGDVAEVLKQLRDPFDFIYLDAAKGQYPAYFPDCLRLLANGGVLVSDDVLFRGMVARGKPDVHRNQTIVTRLREYLDLLNKTENLSTILLPISDGVAVSLKREKELR